MCILLLAPTLLFPLAGAGGLSSFEEGPSTVIGAVPLTPATLRFPNPARATDASVLISTETQLRTVSPPLPVSGRWSEWPACPTLEEPASAFMGTPMTGLDLGNVSSFDGINWTQPATANGCGVVYLEFDATPVLDPMGTPFLDVTIEVAADATSQAGQSEITLALFEEPTVGRNFLQAVTLAPSLTTPGVFTATVPHPPLAVRGPQRLLDLALFCPDGGHNLTVDEVRVSFGVSVDPVSPQVVVGSTGALVWQYRAPGGLNAPFGRTVADSIGLSSAVFSSTGPVVDGATNPLYVPGGAQIRSATLDFLPEPFTDGRSNTSGATSYTVGRLSSSTLPQPPSVEGFPISADPLVGTVTLYGLVSHGVQDAEQPVSSTSYGVGNFTAFERSTAQTFTVGQDGAIEMIQLELADATGHPVGPLVLELHSVTAGVPDNATIATATVNATAGRPGGWVNFTFSPAVNVVQGQVLAAVLASPAATAAQTWDWRGHNGVTSDPYAGGSAFISVNASGRGPWAPQANQDMAFKVAMSAAFNESLAAFVSPAGSTGPPVRTGNYSGTSTGWTWSIPGAAIDFVPDGLGGGIWQVPVVNGLLLDIEYRWDASIRFDISPRAVELGVGNRSAFLSIPDLKQRTVVDFTAELQAALAAGEYIEVPQGGNLFWFFPLRVHADGPANITLAAFDVAYGATVVVTGFAGALNTALAAAAPGNATADVALTLVATSGALRLSAVSVTFSEAPFSPAPVQPPLIVPEGSVNYTVVDLLQWFIDDQGPLALTFSIDSVTNPLATAQVHRGPIDANLTITMIDPEFAGNFSLTARATDQTGLFATRTFNITVVAVDDPPVFLPLPDAILANTTGTLDLLAYLSDEDTLFSRVNISVSSVFTRVAGNLLQFDYRSAPANFTFETMTVYADDGTTNVSATLRVFVNNAGRPTLSYPGPIPVVMGHAVMLDLDGFAEDDVDPDAQLEWVVVLSTGTTGTPGAAQVTTLPGRRLSIQPVAAGEVDVTLSVRDKEGNVAQGILRLHIVANQPPEFITLYGATFQLEGDELRIPLASYIEDPDDDFANFTFNLGWGGNAATAVIEGGDLVVLPRGSAGGSVNVSLVVIDPAGATSTAEFIVVVPPSASTSSGALLVPLLFVVGAGGIGALLFLSYRKGQSRKPSLSSMEREEGEADDGDEEGGASSDRALASLEKTDDDRMLEDLDRLELQADKPRMELPPVTIFGVANAKASTLILLYRDGRPISWGATGSPSDKERATAQELAAALRDEASTPGDRKEWATLERGGQRMIVEGRAQLVLGAVLTKGADEAIVRLNMRAALERIFDEHAEQLKRWDGSRKGLGGVDDVLESLLRRS